MPTPSPAVLRPSTIYRRLMERLPIRYADIHRAGGAVGPLQFNAAQERLWAHVAPALDARGRTRVIVLKARQTGVSTFTEGLITAASVLNDYCQSMVVAQKKQATQRIWAMSKLFVEQSPLKAIARVTGQVVQCRHSEITLATAGTPDAARSAQLTCFHGSEVAFWPDPDAMLAILQCLPRAEDVFSIGVIESTANGMVEAGELFYEEWQRACRGESGFEPVFLPWHTFPLYSDRRSTPLDSLTSDEEELRRDLGLTWGQLRWRRRVLADECQDNEDKWNQEYPATPEMAFIVSGIPFFPTRLLTYLEPCVEGGRRGMLVERGDRIRFVSTSEGALRVFRPPVPGREYVIGADSAMGHDERSHSRSAAEVLDMATLEQVAELEGPLAPYAFARELALLGRAYNEALLMPEVQGSGGGGGRELIVYLRDQYQYPNLGRWRGANDRIRNYQPILYGWETTSRTKPMMLARLQEVIFERSLIVHSRALLSQLRSYGQKDSGAMEALSGHDDLVMALGIALMARFQEFIVMPKQAPTPGQLPFDAMHLEHQQDIHDRDKGMLEEVLAGMGGSAPALPRTFMEW